MDDATQPTNESILFTFPCCQKKAHLTFGDLSGLIEGESRQCPGCSEVAILRHHDRQPMNELLTSAARKGKLMTGFCAVWFGGGLVLHLLYDFTVTLPFFVVGLLIYFGFMQHSANGGVTDVLLVKPTEESPGSDRDNTMMIRPSSQPDSA